MYKITYTHDGSTVENSLYIPGDEDYCLLSFKLSLAMGKAGSLTMEVPRTNPAKDHIACLTDEVIFYRNGIELFRGRAITAQGDFNRTGTLECEGILAYLYDTWYPPYDFKGSPSDLIADVLVNHNAKVEERKRLYVGTITVTDPNDYISRSNQDYSRCLDVLQDKLVGESLGGYLRVRYQEGKRYLDYLDNYGGEATQTIEFGYNLLDIATDVNYGSVVTAILPLGAEVEETATGADGDEITTTKRVTVESANNGSLYVSDAKAVAKYGWIADCVTWDDVTLPENLLTKAQAYLATVTSGIRTVTVKAVDMALVEPSVTSIFLGDAVHISSPPHDIDLTAELTEMEIGLDPGQNTLTFGTVERLSDIVHRNQSNAVTLVQAERKNRQTAMERLSKAISEGSGMYITPDEQPDGSEIYYLHDKKSLSESKYVIRVNSQSISFSTDGGATYPFGYTVDGALVMDIIEANGISADWVKFGSQTITEKINGLEDADAKNVEMLRSELEVNANNIRQEVSGAYATKDDLNSTKASLELSIGKKVGTDELISKINASADEINLTGDRLVIDSTNFQLAADGTLTTTNGTIGGWTITDTKIKAGDASSGVAVMQAPTLDTTYTFAAGGTSHESYKDCPFRVTKAGKLYASDADISGTVETEMQVEVSLGGSNSLTDTVYAKLERGAIYGKSWDDMNYTAPWYWQIGDIPMGLCFYRLDGTYHNYYSTYGPDYADIVGRLDVTGNITTGGNISISSPYSDGNRSIYCKWKDGSNHDLIVRSSDGLSTGVGWAGSDSYSTVLNLRSRTVRLINSSGTSTLSDERMKKDWKGLEAYDAFFDALNPLAFRYVDGSSGRYHLGFGAQSVERALADSGLSNADFGGLIKYAVPLESDDWRGYSEEYGLIYTEFVALLVDQVKRLKARVSELESQQASMEQRLAALEKLIGG